MKAKNAALLDKIDDTKVLDKDAEKELGDDAIAELFKKLSSGVLYYEVAPDLAAHGSW